MSTKAEENYLKTIFKLSEKEKDSVSTNAIAEELEMYSDFSLSKDIQTSKFIWKLRLTFSNTLF